ncbi:hypothetical protein PYK79_45325 [Streptomyces sp. ID05-04B]|nr:hypothetical protein [Streptomyces sp. ID05-04B]
MTHEVSAVGADVSGRGGAVRSSCHGACLPSTSPPRSASRIERLVTSGRSPGAVCLHVNALVSAETLLRGGPDPPAAPSRASAPSSPPSGTSR